MDEKGNGTASALGASAKDVAGRFVGLVRADDVHLTRAGCGRRRRLEAEGEPGPGEGAGPGGPPPIQGSAADASVGLAIRNQVGRVG